MKSVNSPISMRPAQHKVSQEFIGNRKGGANSPLAMPGGGVWGVFPEGVYQNSEAGGLHPKSVKPQMPPQHHDNDSANKVVPGTATNFTNYRK